MYPELTEEQRFPILSPEGRKLLYRMRQHPHAPLWNWPNGEQLDAVGLEKVFDFQKRLFSQPRFESLDPPDWLDSFVQNCLSQVPFYRQRSPHGTRFEHIPTFRRADLAPRVWDFVPDNQPLDQLITFSSSGTTGYPTRTPHHPFSSACGVPLIEYALSELHSIRFPRNPEQVAITNIAAYPGAFTTAIVVSYLHEAGCIRVNLDQSAWKAPQDRSAYINHWQAPVWLGDPVALGAIESLDIDHQPKAIVSSIMQLTDAYSSHLSQRYGCPVVDLYAMTEAGIIAAGTPSGHRILPHDLHVEILNADDTPCPPNTTGEIVLTGGRNPFLPLLRYRTGDFGSLSLIDGHRFIVGLSGRTPVDYRSSSGERIHSMQLNHLIRRHCVQRYQMKPQIDGTYRLEIQGNVDQASLLTEVEELFGSNVQVIFEPKVSAPTR